jgi:hypothetical protein
MKNIKFMFKLSLNYSNVIVGCSIHYSILWNIVVASFYYNTLIITQYLLVHRLVLTTFVHEM